MRLLWKDALSMKLLRKPELSINICLESLYVINIAFGYDKNNPTRRAGEKKKFSTLSEKKNSARTKSPSPPPPWISNGPCLIPYIYIHVNWTRVSCYWCFWFNFKFYEEVEQVLTILTNVYRRYNIIRLLCKLWKVFVSLMPSWPYVCSTIFRRG